MELARKPIILNPVRHPDSHSTSTTLRQMAKPSVIAHTKLNVEHIESKDHVKPLTASPVTPKHDSREQNSKPPQLILEPVAVVKEHVSVCIIRKEW